MELSVKTVHSCQPLKTITTTSFILNVAAPFRSVIVVITTAQLHSTKPELRFCVSSNPADSVSEIRDGEDL